MNSMNPPWAAGWPGRPDPLAPTVITTGPVPASAPPRPTWTAAARAARGPPRSTGPRWTRVRAGAARDGRSAVPVRVSARASVPGGRARRLPRTRRQARPAHLAR